VTEPGRTIATIGVLLVASALLALRRRRPVRLMGHTLLSFRGAVSALLAGCLLIGMGLMVAYPERG
jgi:hypothetical protein